MRKRCYRLYVGRVLVAQGDVELIADVMHVKEATAYHYINPNFRPEWMHVESLPRLYERDGVLLTLPEMAKSLKIAESTIEASASKGVPVRGLPISRYEYEPFRLPNSKVQALIEQAKEKRHG